ncbi:MULTISPECIES: hypothetical protein [Corallococcus]|uniref:hypothetical protein n=1 Tax=Corallococcus TaxID=83461 RepID=UPI001180CC03|nr:MULTISPECIES: hypothetical protein [Corallococcus]NBD10132.1 hypothetical protein [Corallococcus silvisoli]TSC28386.1 hypothetical protein FOF48_17165 [Corallococcus sp. Z5C101001]
MFVAALLSAATASAQCTGDGVQLYPSPGGIVPTNMRLLLEGVGTARSPVLALVGKPLKLVASDHEVTLKVTKGWESTLGRAVIILKPSEPMQPDKRYTLRLGEVLPNVPILNGQPGAQPSWLSGKGPDTKAPKWVKRPAVSEGFVRRSPQGIARFVKLNLALREESPAFLVVKLSPRRLGISPQQYLLPVQSNTAYLGHEACGGAFALEDGRSYRARIEAFDAAGNLAPSTPPVDFEAPSAKGP